MLSKLGPLFNRYPITHPDSKFSEESQDFVNMLEKFDKATSKDNANVPIKILLEVMNDKLTVAAKAKAQSDNKNGLKTYTETEDPSLRDAETLYAIVSVNSGARFDDDDDAEEVQDFIEQATDQLTLTFLADDRFTGANEFQLGFDEVASKELEKL